MSYSEKTLLPSVDKLNSFEHGRFVLSNMAAKRAKQIHDGAPPLVDLPSNHPISIALGEIAENKIEAILASEEMMPISLNVEPVESAQMGLLLPSLDDIELSNPLDLEDHHEDEHEHESLLGLSDLLDEPTVDPEHMQSSEENTISLNELESEELLEDQEEGQ